MAREAKAIAAAHRTHGVWGVLDIDGQHEQIDELDALEAKHRTLTEAGRTLDSEDVARLAWLRVAAGDMLAARVLPMSGDEYAEIEGAKISAAMTLASDGRGGAKIKRFDAKAATFDLMLEIIEKRVTEIRGYAKREILAVDADGVPTDERSIPITTGADFVAFMRSPDCPTSEREVAQALFALVTSQSHLDAALGKWSASRRASSPATTRPSAGDALAATPTTSTPATT